MTIVAKRSLISRPGLDNRAPRVDHAEGGTKTWEGRMFAIFVEVETGDADMDAALTDLKQNRIPHLREAGARAGYWLDSVGGSRRVSMMVFDTEQAARAVADGMKVGETPAGAPEGLKLRTVEVSEVLANL
ncbi:MAG: hypothetical protein ABIO83_09830 [Ilumatobacteraceae bacterium]